MYLLEEFVSALASAKFSCRQDRIGEVLARKIIANNWILKVNVATPFYKNIYEELRWFSFHA